MKKLLLLLLLLSCKVSNSDNLDYTLFLLNKNPKPAGIYSLFNFSKGKPDLLSFRKIEVQDTYINSTEKNLVNNIQQKSDWCNENNFELVSCNNFVYTLSNNTQVKFSMYYDLARWFYLENNILYWLEKK